MEFTLNLQITYSNNEYTVSCDAPSQGRVTGTSKTDLLLAFNRFLVNLSEYLKTL